MKKRNRALASATVLSLVLTSTVTATNVQAAAEVTRVQGANRETTSMEVAKQAFGTAETVVLVNGYGYADAVSATPLAKALNAPILLTNKVDAPTAELTATLAKLGAKNVVIVGGEGAVTPAMETALKANYGVKRIGGASRYETNALVAKEVLAKTGAKAGVLVSAEGYADALSVASIAAAKGMPVLFGNKNEVPAAVKTVAAGLEVVAVGGEGVLPASVLTAVNATRVAQGATRFETNLAVLDHFKGDLKLENIYVAAGGATVTGFADALVASAAAAKVAAPVVLTGAGANATAVEKANDYVAKNIGENTKITVIGGEGSVSKSIFNDLEEIVNPDVDNKELAVESVTSLNAAQIKVTFNKELTEDEVEDAEDIDNYTLNDTDGDEIDDIIADVDAEEGRDYVILTVDYSKMGEDDGDYQNQATFELVIDDNVTGTEVSKEFKVSDFTIPEVKSVEVVGVRTIKVKVSEPIVAKAGSQLADAFEVNDGDYSVEKVESINNGTEFNVVLYSDLKDGEQLTVDAKSEAVDYAGYSLKKASFKTTADFDNSELTIVSYKKAEDHKITLVFNKDITFNEYEDETKVYSDAVTGTDEADYVADGFKEISKGSDTIEGLYHSSSKNVVEAAEIDGNELTLYFGEDEVLPETAYVYVDADVLVDLWEVENDDLFIKAAIAKDTVKPTVKTVEQDEDYNDRIVITFSEDIDTATAEEEDNYTVTDKDGNKVRVSKAQKTDDDEVTLTMTKDLENAVEYTVAIEDVEDEAGNKMADVTKKFVAYETQSVTGDDVVARFYDAGKSSQKIVVDFDTAMLADGSRYAINNLENYDLVVTQNGTTYSSINLSDYDGATISAVDGKTKVEIKLPGNDADQDDSFDFSKAGTTLKLTVSKVDDANGNRTNVIEETVLSNDTVTLDDEDESPVATDPETIKVVFGDELSFKNDDVTLAYNDGTEHVITPSSTKVTKADGVTTVTYTLSEKDQLAYNGKYKGLYDVYVKTEADATKIDTENSYGDKLLAGQSWKVMDEIAPELALIDADASTSPSAIKAGVVLDDRDDYEDAVVVTGFNTTTNTATVTLTFEEDLTNVNVNKYTFKTDDSDVKVIDATLSGKVITLTLDAADDNKDFTDAEDFLGLGISTGTNELFDLATAGGHDEVNGAVIDTQIELVDIK